MESLSSPTIRRAAFGTMPTGLAVSLYTLRNRAGMEVGITDYGGIVTRLTAPDRRGRFEDVVLGYDTLAGYLHDSAYCGALIGRYANRIASGRFALHGVVHSLATNDGPHSLHGGQVGFDKVLWHVKDARVTAQGPALTLQHLSHDGDQGYPGNLTVTAVYTLTDDNALRLDFRGTTDRDTVVNLTQHSYFNLRGRGDILDHILQIHAERYSPVDAMMIPTGELWSVAGTPFDFRTPIAVGQRISAGDEQLRVAGGYDHNWVLAATDGKLAPHATVYEPESGRVLEVSSTQPGLQFYSGNLLDAAMAGKGGAPYAARSGLCLEPQHFPDAPNRPAFPSAALSPGEVYRQSLTYRLSARA
jgi:aldose 1-epimerase